MLTKYDTLHEALKARLQQQQEEYLALLQQEQLDVAKMVSDEQQNIRASIEGVEVGVRAASSAGSSHTVVLCSAIERGCWRCTSRCT